MHVMGILLVLVVALVASPVTAKIQCECPTIKAKGKGETSCSAVETNNQCEIDFNLFGPAAEERAFKVIKEEAGVDRLVFSPNNRSASDLWRLDPELLTGTIAVYLFVAAANSGLNLDIRFVKEVTTILQNANLKDHFGEEASRGADVSTVVSRSDSVVVRFANGCVEAVHSNEIWVMYKAAWSPTPTGQFPQCGPKSLQ